MGHEICALVVPAPIDVAKAAEFDLHVRLEHSGVVVLPIDHYYSAYWGAVRSTAGRFDLPADLAVTFPAELVLAELVAAITNLGRPRFAVIQTDYFGGAGAQWAVVFRGRAPESGGVTINHALEALGVRPEPPKDAFDTIGLGAFRHNPEHLERYRDLCDELGMYPVNPGN